MLNVWWMKFLCNNLFKEHIFITEINTYTDWKVIIITGNVFTTEL